MNDLRLTHEQQQKIRKVVSDIIKENSMLDFEDMQISTFRVDAKIVDRVGEIHIHFDLDRQQTMWDGLGAGGSVDSTFLQAFNEAIRKRDNNA